MRAIGILGLALAALAGLAAAKAVPDGGITAQEVAAVLQERGYRAEVGKNADGDPEIISGLDGSKFYIQFYGCKGGARCTGIQFSIGIDLDKGMTLAKINQWNRERRFGRAFLDDDNDPYVQMDLDLEHGATTEGVANNLDTWAAVLPEFKAFIAE